jgi:hypothetical protein
MNFYLNLIFFVSFPIGKDFDEIKTLFTPTTDLKLQLNDTIISGLTKISEIAKLSGFYCSGKLQGEPARFSHSMTDF